MTEKVETVEQEPAVSFRSLVEQSLENHHGRLSALEGSASGQDADSVPGLLRTFDARITQVETVQAENTSALLRLSDLVQNRLAGLEARVKALEPHPGT